MQPGGSACGHPTAPFARLGACIRASHRGGNRVRGTGRIDRGGSTIGVGGGNGNGDGDGAGAGAGAGTGKVVEANKGAQDGNGDGSGDEAGASAGTEVETRRRTQDGSGDGNESSSGGGTRDVDGNGNGNEDRVGEGGGETKKRKKPHKSYRRDVGNGGDLDGKRKTRRKERAGPVPANPDNLKNSKEAKGGAQITQGLSKNCIRRECVFLLSRPIRGFRNKYHRSTLGRTNASGIE